MNNSCELNFLLNYLNLFPFHKILKEYLKVNLITCFQHQPLPHETAPFSLIHSDYSFTWHLKRKHQHNQTDNTTSTCKVLRKEKSKNVSIICCSWKPCETSQGRALQVNELTSNPSSLRKLSRAHTKQFNTLTEQTTHEHTQQWNKTQSINLKALQIIVFMFPSAYMY